MNIFNIITLLGGLALFLYGMRIMGDGLKEGSTDTLKNAILKVTNNPIKGFLVGLLLTAIIQSSTATIVITSGLVGAGIITLHQSLGIILGANVGTTVTGQIIRLLDVDASGAEWLNIFKPSTLAPIAAIIGIVCIMALSKKKNGNTIGTIAMGFGILFTGLLSMTGAVEPLSQSPEFQALFTNIGDNPVLGYLIGAGVAFVLQSSSATIGVLQALAVTGALKFNSTFPIIIGVYLGDCVTTAIVCSIGAKADAKRTGIIHILFNLCETALIAIVMLILHKTGALDSMWNMTMTSGTIANTHTIFNLSCAVLLLPLAGFYEKLSCKIIKDDKVIGTSIDAELKLLDDKLFASPALALKAAHTALNSMAKLAQEGVINALQVLSGEFNQEAIDVIEENEKNIDRLADEVDNYLMKLSPHVPSGHHNDVLNYYIQCLSEFERIGDYAVNLTENATELRSKGEVFSPFAKEELAIASEAIRDILAHAYAAFSRRDATEARIIEPIEEVVDDMVETLRAGHIKRLREGTCIMYAGLEFLDALVSIERVADQCSNIGIYTVALLDEHVRNNHHEYIHELHQGTNEFFNEQYNEKREYYFGELNSLKMNSLID